MVSTASPARRAASGAWAACLTLAPLNSSGTTLRNSPVIWLWKISAICVAAARRASSPEPPSSRTITSLIMEPSHLDLQFERFDQGHGQHDRIDCDNPKRVELAALPADRDVFTRPKGMRFKTVAGLVVVILVVTVVEDPARAVGAARLVDEATDLVVFAIPESANAAIVPILFP